MSGWGVGIPLASLIFAAGYLAGTTLAPVTESRGAGLPPDPTIAEPVAQTYPARFAHSAEVLRVIDGDTFEARVHLWPGLDVTTRVRLRGVDAPELRARCDGERAKAETARDALRAMLGQGEVGIAHVTLDKYGGRVVADAFTRTTPDVSAALLESGLARRYGGGRRDGWCR